MGEGRRPSSKLKISRRRIVSSGDYGDFVVSNSRRESFRSCTNILESPCQLFRKEVKYPKLHHLKLYQMNKHDQGTHILNSGAFELYISSISLLQRLQREKFCHHELRLREVLIWYKSGHGGITPQVLSTI